MINSRLFLFEGIPGSGKTTVSRRLHDYLSGKGIHTDLYLEGCEHPIDLPFYAYLSHEEFDQLLLNYPRQSDWFSIKSVKEDGYFLVPYKIPPIEPADGNAVGYLASKEFCYSKVPVVSFGTFKSVFATRFARYAGSEAARNTVSIMESVLFQHQIHDINRLYPQVGDDEIVGYLRLLADAIRALHPVLFYISQDSVRESLIRTAETRSNSKWASEESVDYWTKRKGVEMSAISKLPIEAHIMDNSDYCWDKLFENVVGVVDSHISMG